jgi:RNA polymerase sigma-70 factor (ECF subfamily)
MTREALSEVKNFKAYLFTVSRNAAISSLRKIINERTKHIEWIKNPSVDDDDALEKETYLSLIDEAINCLSPQRKKIYLLSREQGLKYDEIADQLGISRHTVRAHIQQAVDSIVQYVKARIDNLSVLMFISKFL